MHLEQNKRSTIQNRLKPKKDRIGLPPTRRNTGMYSHWVHCFKYISPITIIQIGIMIVIPKSLFSHRISSFLRKSTSPFEDLCVSLTTPNSWEYEGGGTGRNKWNHHWWNIYIYYSGLYHSARQSTLHMTEVDCQQNLVFVVWQLVL
jgi:hypothetical protein